MPAYHKVPVLDELQLIVDQHKIKPIDAHAARTLMTKVLTKCSKLGLENAKMRLAYLEDAQKNAKGTLASMEKLLQELEDPWYTPEVFKLPTLQAGLKTIQMQVEGADADGKVLFELMTQYRASWASTIEKVVGKEQDFVDVHIAIRTQTMVLGKQSIGALDRMKEYVKRAEQISKAAEKARAGGEQSAQEAKAEADGLLKLIEQAESDAAKRLIDSSKKSNKLKPFKTQKPYTGKDHKLAESFFQE
ncbi:MAG TPA: hypothetical protein H9903_03375, partial [Candidatus Aquabacterium excrementipullorum]|nr:hypothetical protein [Candidatus Aquabacterium excrementipullorum]